MKFLVFLFQILFAFTLTACGSFFLPPKDFLAPTIEKLEDRDFAVKTVELKYDVTGLQYDGNGKLTIGKPVPREKKNDTSDDFSHLADDRDDLLNLIDSFLAQDKTIRSFKFKEHDPKGKNEVYNGTELIMYYPGLKSPDQQHLLANACRMYSDTDNLIQELEKSEPYIVLFRHELKDQQGGGREQDIGLSDAGKNRASSIAAPFQKNFEPFITHTSTYDRAFQTGKLISQNSDRVVKNPALDRNSDWKDLKSALWEIWKRREKPELNLLVVSHEGNLNGFISDNHEKKYFSFQEGDSAVLVPLSNGQFGCMVYLKNTDWVHLR